MWKRIGRRGVVLIFAIAMLVLLSLMGATFATVARVERTVARNYVDVVRARMLAHSGVEAVVARLSTDAADPARWGAWAAPDGATPLEQLATPSYAIDRNRDGRITDADRVDVDGTLLGATVLLPGTYAADGDSASVRVTEVSSRFPLDLASPRMSAMIATLCRAAGLPPAVAAGLERNRTAPTMTFLREALFRERVVDAAGWARVRAIVSIGAWRDPDVVAPVPLEERRRPRLAASPPPAPTRSGGASSIPPSGGVHVYTWEEMRPNAIRPAPGGRPPVYLGEAPKPVLVALLAGLQGFWLDEESFAQPIDNPYDMLYIHHTYEGEDGSLGLIRLTAPIAYDQAVAIANDIIARRAVRPFREWQDFERFVKRDLVVKGLVDAQQADVLCANANPNSCVNDFNPSHERFRWVDKTDLTASSTELSLQPTGSFELESIGRVLGRAHETVAEAKATTMVRIFELHRETTQREFLREHWQDGASLASVISRERGAGSTRGDLSLTSFPELARTDLLRDADWDGSLELATRKAETGDARFTASFEDRIEPESGQAVVPDANGPFVDRLLAGRRSNVGKLFPDGVYSELDSVPMYAFQPASLDDFATSMWLKPHYFPEQAGRSRVYLTWQTSSRWRRTGRPLDVCHGIYQIVSSGGEERSEDGYSYNEGWDTDSILAGGTIGAYATEVGTPRLNHRTHDHEAIQRYGDRWGNMLDSGRWIHIAWVHTARKLPPPVNNVPGYHEEVDVLYIDGQRVGATYALQKYDVGTPCDHAGEPMRLGERRSHAQQNSVPDATIDEVQVWDAINLARADEKMTSIFNDGRYYAEDDGTFRSAPFDAGRPVRLLWTAWTVLRPEKAPGANVVLDVLDAASGSSLLAGPSGLAGGTRIDRMATGAVRYTARFLTGVPFGQPVLESPILDDVTIATTTGVRFEWWMWE